MSEQLPYITALQYTVNPEGNGLTNDQFSTAGLVSDRLYGAYQIVLRILADRGIDWHDPLVGGLKHIHVPRSNIPCLECALDVADVDVVDKHILITTYYENHPYEEHPKGMPRDEEIARFMEPNNMHMRTVYGNDWVYRLATAYQLESFGNRLPGALPGMLGGDVVNAVGLEKNVLHLGASVVEEVMIPRMETRDSMGRPNNRNTVSVKCATVIERGSLTPGARNQETVPAAAPSV